MTAIRDPVHKWIEISREEQAIIDSPLFQRLRNISQLTATSHVFPGGVHKRFIHCIGVMHIAGKYAERLFTSNVYLIKLARIAALLHDIGHGPFSHAYDNTVYKEIYKDISHMKLNNKNQGHDIHRIKLIKSKYLKDLILAAGITIEDIISVWIANDDTVFSIIHNIIQGPLGADRIDFLMRDSYFTGTEHFGSLAPERIISNASIVDGKLHYNIKVMDDIFRMLLGRFYMYKEIYYHKTSMGADMLVQQMIAHAMTSLNLVERTNDIDKFIYLNDGITSEIMNSDDDIAKEYCHKYLMRELPKVVLSLNVPVEDIGLDVTNYLETTYPDLDLSNKIVMHKNPVEMLHYSPFEKKNIRILSRDESISFKEVIKKTHYFKNLVLGENQYVVIRVYSM